MALFLAARKGQILKKLILIGSAVFDAENSSRIESIRLARLNKEQRLLYKKTMRELEGASEEDQTRLADDWGRIFFDTDVYDPLTTDLEVIEVQYELHKKVWSDFVTLRDRPRFLKNEFSKIKVPVVVIQGDYDPHPIEGIRPFLEGCLPKVSFHILPECGHYPWIERQAIDKFYEILKREI